MSVGGTAAITGIGELKPSRDPNGRTTMELMAQAALEAVRDAGLEKQDIDGLVVAMPMSWSPMVMPSVVAAGAAVVTAGFQRTQRSVAY